MGRDLTIATIEGTGPGRQILGEEVVKFPNDDVGRSVGLVGVLSETVSYDAFTDGGGTSGTYQMLGSLPKGAVVLGTKVLVTDGFAGDTSAVLVIGDGSDVDRYSTGTPSVFATQADGIQTGVPSGTKLLTSANRPTLTVTAAVNWGDVSAGTLEVNIYYIDA